MTALKSMLRKAISIDGLIDLTFIIFALTIPMQHRFHKLFRPLAKAVTKEGMDLPAFFERMVYYCISDVFILVLLLAFLFKRSLAARSFFTHQSSKYLSLYFLVALFSLILSKNSNYLLQYIRLAQLVWAGGVFFIISQGLISSDLPRLLRRFMKLTVIAAVLESVVAVVQYFTQHAIGLKKLGEINFSSAQYFPSSFHMPDGSLWVFDHLFSEPSSHQIIARAYGTLPDPNILGGYLVFSLLASCYLFMSSSKKIKILLGAAIFVQFFALFITFSRSAYIGIILGSIVFFSLEAVRRYRRKTRGLAVSGLSNKALPILMTSCFAACMLLFYPQLLQRGGYVNYKNTLAANADSERILYQEIASNIMGRYPILGVGFNNYTIDMKQHTDQELPYYFSHPVHNVFLLVASETGLLGLMSFCFFVFTSAWGMLKKELTPESAVLAALLIAFLFISCCSHYYLSWPTGRLMFFSVLGFIGLAGAAKKKETYTAKGIHSEVTI